MVSPGRTGRWLPRREPARVVGGWPEGGYTDAYELICCDCGDDPDLDYQEVSPELQQIRASYPIAVGVEAYEKHVGRHKTRPTFESASR